MYGPNIVPLSEILTKRLAEIDWGPEYDSTGSSELLKDGAQVILHRTHAIGLCILQLACEAACAAFECVIIEVYPLYLESMSFRASPALSMACAVFHFLRGLPLITNALITCGLSSYT